MLTLPDHDSMVLNIMAFYADATPAERAEGFAWYPSAHVEAQRLASLHGLAVEVTTAVIAALSPQTSWSHNVRWANAACAAAVAGQPVPRLGLGNNAVRAERALAGDLSDILREDGTLKVRNFYGSIIGERGAVCVDRHALRIAFGDATLSEVPGITDKRYRDVASAYRDAASEVRKGARHVQAITWLVCRRQRALPAHAPLAA